MGHCEQQAGCPWFDDSELSLPEEADIPLLDISEKWNKSYGRMIFQDADFWGFATRIWISRSFTYALSTEM